MNATVDYWIPASPDPSRLKNRDWNVVARLRDGATLQQAQTELNVLNNREIQNERDFAGIVPQVHSLTAELNQDGRRILLPLLGAAALVLVYRVRECRGAATGARIAAAAGVRGAERARNRAVGVVPASGHRESCCWRCWAERLELAWRSEW